MLSDPEKRRQYDQFGHAAFEQGGGAGGFGGFGGFDFGGDMGDIFGDIFGDLFGGGRSRRAYNGPMQGANVKINMRISFMEAVFGVDKRIEINLKDECPHCHGTGAKPGTQPETCPKCGGKGQVVYTQQSLFGAVRNVQTCPDCHGTGKIVKEKCTDCGGTGYIKNKKTIEIPIPAGIDSGQSVRIRGKGEPEQTAGQEAIFLWGLPWIGIRFSSGRILIFIPPCRFHLLRQRLAGILRSRRWTAMWFRISVRGLRPIPASA